MSLLLGLAAAAQATVAAPRGLSLREAQTLPAPNVVERVLGSVGALYPEVGRPSPSITRGRGFQISFASTPRAPGYPGLCMADVIDVDFGPAADSPPTSIAYVQAVYRRTRYRIVGDTTPPARGLRDSDLSALAARCAAAGPVPSPQGAMPRFFYNQSYSGDAWASHAYFGARALAMASSGALPPAECRDLVPRPGDRVCDDPAALLRNPPMNRFLGFRIDRCKEGSHDLCVTASFSRGTRPDGGFIDIRIWTALSEAYNPPREFDLREIRILAAIPIP